MTRNGHFVLTPFFLSIILHGYALLIPESHGKYRVALSTAKLIDESRIDPYDSDKGTRSVMISLFYPVNHEECPHTCRVPYAPPLTGSYIDAEVALVGIPVNRTFQSFQLQVCCNTTSQTAQAPTSFPIVLFSAGLLGSRLQYNVMAQRIASEGYAVVTVDSTHGSSIVEFPDGTNVAGMNISYWCKANVTDVCAPTSNIPFLLETQVQDAVFLLDQLKKPEVVSKLIPGATSGFNTSRVAHCGHSFGGAAAIRTSMEDNRIVGALNLDGGQFGNITDSHAAALLFGRSDPVSHNITDDVTWQEAWKHLKGWREQIGLKDAQHRTFYDIPYLSKLAGWNVTEELQQLIGILDGDRSFNIITTYIVAFLDFTLERGNASLFEKSSERFPEVVVGI